MISRICRLLFVIGTFIFPMLGVMGINARNAPVFTIDDVLTAESSCIVQVSVSNFTNIAGGNLKIRYNPDVAMAVHVTKGEGLPGNLDYNVSEKGVLHIGWYTFPAVSLTDESVLFEVHFKRTSPGTTGVAFDGTGSGMDCQFYDSDHRKFDDEPFETCYRSGKMTFVHDCPVIRAPVRVVTAGEFLAIPLEVQGFNNIGAVSLMLKYDPNVLEYQGEENSGNFPGLLIRNPMAGIVTISGIFDGEDGFSLSDGAPLVTLYYRFNGGVSELVWYDDGTSCEYAGPQSAYVINDTPYEAYYKNGRTGDCPGPGKPVVSAIQPDCASPTGSVFLETDDADISLYSIDGYSYQTSNFFTNLLPGVYYATVMDEQGCRSSAAEVVLTDAISRPDAPVVVVQAATCDSNGSARISCYDSGTTYAFSPAGPTIDTEGNITGYIPGQVYTLSAFSMDGCKSLSSGPFIIKDRYKAPVPVISVVHNPANCEQGCLVLKSSSGVHYQWSTGDTTQRIVVNAPGEYFVEVTYKNGCTATSAVLPVVVSPAGFIETIDDGLVVKAYPNPFSDQLTIDVTASHSGELIINLYDVTGKLTDTYQGTVYPGEARCVVFLPADWSTGIFYYNVSMGDDRRSGVVIRKD